LYKFSNTNDNKPNLTCAQIKTIIKNILHSSHFQDNLWKYGLYTIRYDIEPSIGLISGKIISCRFNLVKYSFIGLDSSKIYAGLISCGASGEYKTSGGKFITV